MPPAVTPAAGSITAPSRLPSDPPEALRNTLRDIYGCMAMSVVDLDTIPSDAKECPVCYANYEDQYKTDENGNKVINIEAVTVPVRLPCDLRHMMCRGCANQVLYDLNRNPKCPTCRVDFIPGHLRRRVKTNYAVGGYSLATLRYQVMYSYFGGRTDNISSGMVKKALDFSADAVINFNEEQVIEALVSTCPSVPLNDGLFHEGVLQFIPEDVPKGLLDRRGLGIPYEAMRRALLHHLADPETTMTVKKLQTLLETSMEIAVLVDTNIEELSNVQSASLIDWSYRVSHRLVGLSRMTWRYGLDKDSMPAYYEAMTKALDFAMKFQAYLSASTNAEREDARSGGLYVYECFGVPYLVTVDTIPLLIEDRYTRNQIQLATQPTPAAEDDEENSDEDDPGWGDEIDEEGAAWLRSQVLRHTVADYTQARRRAELIAQDPADDTPRDAEMRRNLGLPGAQSLMLQ